MTKINRFITSSISKSMKDCGFTETFPSIYDPSVINRFMFGHCVLSYFIMKSLLEKRRKILPCFPSKRESAVHHLVYFVNSRSDSYANKSHEISFLLIHFVVKLN